MLHSLIETPGGVSARDADIVLAQAIRRLEAAKHREGADEQLPLPGFFAGVEACIAEVQRLRREWVAAASAVGQTVKAAEEAAERHLSSEREAPNTELRQKAGDGKPENWPNGCLFPTTCASHEGCMYAGCPYEGETW